MELASHRMVTLETGCCTESLTAFATVPCFTTLIHFVPQNTTPTRICFEAVAAVWGWDNEEHSSLSVGQFLIVGLAVL
jgi:hypothetical protein